MVRWLEAEWEHYRLTFYHEVNKKRMVKSLTIDERKIIKIIWKENKMMIDRFKKP